MQRRAWPGRGAMATASGCGAFAPLAGFPALNGLAALRKTTHFALLLSNKFCEHETVASQATLGRKTVHRGRLCFIRAATRPCTALRGRASGAAGEGRCLW